MFPFIKLFKQLFGKLLVAASGRQFDQMQIKSKNRFHQYQ